ncbi:ABC transporter ATP-binding protein [Candidatus Riflebacteria bacterium]
MAGITFKKIRKSYGDNVIINNADFEVADKEFLVLLGPSGCGKSTLLRMIAGLETISDGQLIIGDTIANDLEPGERDVAFVFQNYALYPHMTVRENMGFALENLNFKPDEINDRVKEAVEILGLDELLERLPGEMSGGQRQRVAIGRAIVRKPKAFLMDEPLSNLDAKLRVKMRAELAKLHDELSTTFVYVTHDQVEAMTMASRIVILFAGDIQQIGTPLDIYRQPYNKFVAGFIGSPSMNFLDLQVSKDRSNLKADGVNIVTSPIFRPRLENYSEKKLTVGVRPHHLLPCDKSEAMFSGIIRIIEPFGSETYTNLDLTEDTQLTCRLEETEIVEKGKEFFLKAKPENLYFFDPDSGLSLY